MSGFDTPARLTGGAMGYVDDDGQWHDFDGVEVSFLIPSELAGEVSVGIRGRLVFIPEVSNVRS